MTHDESLADAIAVLALGALPAAEARPLAAHIATCGTCRREYAALREAADFVGYAAELPAAALDQVGAQRLKSRVMQAVRSDAAGSEPSVPERARAANRDGVAAPPAARTSWLAYGAAAAAALVATLSLVDDASQRAANGRATARLAHLEGADRELARANRALAGRVAQIVAPGSKHFAVASGEVVASRGRIIVALHDLPALPKGKVYQAWTLARGTKTMAPSVTFAPDAAGLAIVEISRDAAGTAAVAVSVEPDGGSSKPTSKPTFLRALS